MARTTRGRAASAWSVSHCAQQMVRRTHSGDGADEGGIAGALGVLGTVLGSSSKGILSQRTNAASCCTRTREFVPTNDSRTRDAVRARWARGVEPFLSKSRVFSAGGQGCQRYQSIADHTCGWRASRLGNASSSAQE